MTLDYRFGWRWLLPVFVDNHVLLLGMDHEEEAFWKDWVGLVGSPKPENASFLIVKDSPPEDMLFPRLGGFAVVGHRSLVLKWRNWAAGRFSVTRQYSLLPPADPRLVIPLSRRRHTIEGLALHQPGRRLLRFASKTLAQLARFWIIRPLERRVLFIAHGLGATPRGAVKADVKWDNLKNDVTLYLGTPDENRKTVVLVHGNSRPFLVKSGETLKAIAALRNEAHALKLLSHTKLARNVPRSLKYVENSLCAALHQEYRKRVPVRSAIEEVAVTEFLSKLSLVQRKEKELSEVLAQGEALRGIALCRAASVAGQVLSELGERARRGARVLGHRCHGDFAPWNVCWSDKGLWVFDWESSRDWAPALDDAFNYKVAPSLHVKGKNRSPHFLQRASLALWRSSAALAGLSQKEGRLYWALWLLCQAGKAQSKFYIELLSHLEATWKKMSV